MKTSKAKKEIKYSLIEKVMLLKLAKIQIGTRNVVKIINSKEIPSTPRS